jgi:amino acid adenylation domain-containing protein
MFNGMGGKHAPGLVQGFLRSVEAFGGHLAIEVGGETLTYEALFRKAASLAATLTQHQTSAAGPPLTAVYAYRSSTAFAGILAALLRGHGYVPLNRTFPVERTKIMLRRSGCRALVVDAGSEDQLNQILGEMENGMLIVLPERQDVRDYASRWTKHRFIGASSLVSDAQWNPVDVSADSIAYLLFTSGSTGIAKGVMVVHRNIKPYIDFIADRYSINCDDRFSQTFDLTFDLSVSDMFVAWERGACVCCPSEKVLINPGRFINDARLTIWFSVPSTAVFMKRLGSLKAGAYPRLRVSLFCGEALSVQLAKAWAAAAPNSIVENLYGPTELTIACSYYRWAPEHTPSESASGLVPIGEPFPGMRAVVVDDLLNEVRPGEAGELLMTGPQLSLGYWNDPLQTATAFVTPPGRSEVYYRTGDRVRRHEGKGPLLYLGRTDDQIKILGYRVELGEIEAVVREESGIEGVVALGWPQTAGGAGGVEVFLQAAGPTRPGLTQRVANRLPSYMLPRKYHFLTPFPLNATGKYDRKALTKRLEMLS